MLQANELMISDWLCYEGERNIQVKGIDFPPNGNGAYISFGVEFYPCDSFSPIPIIPNILDKNGFLANRHVYPYPYYEYEVKEIKVKVGLAFPQGNKTSYKEPWVCIDTEHVFVEHLPCMFVHQLQQVMRLCGIKKEIVL